MKQGNMKTFFMVFVTLIISNLFQFCASFSFLDGQQTLGRARYRYRPSSSSFNICSRPRNLDLASNDVCKYPMLHRQGQIRSATQLSFSLSDVLLPVTKGKGGTTIISTVATFYRAYPFMSAFLTCAIKASVADIVAQKHFRPKKPSDKDNNQNATEVALVPKVSKQQVSRNGTTKTPSETSILAREIDTNFKSVAGDSTTSSPSAIGIIRNGEVILNPPRSNNGATSKTAAKEKLPWDIDDDDESIDDDVNTSSNKNESIQTNKQQTLAFFLYGGLYQGCVLEFVFNHLMPYWFGTDTGAVTVACKVLFDLSFFSPLVTLPIAYITKALIFRYGLKEALGRYWHDVRYNGLVKKHWMLWGPTNCLTFSIIPKHFRIAFVAFVSFFWMITLSYTSSKSDAMAASSSNSINVGADDNDDVEVCFFSDGYTCDDRRRRKPFRMDSVSLRKGEATA